MNSDLTKMRQATAQVHFLLLNKLYTCSFAMFFFFIFLLEHGLPLSMRLANLCIINVSEGFSITKAVAKQI